MSRSSLKARVSARLLTAAFLLVATPALATCPAQFESSTIASDAECIFRLYNTDGVPSSGPWNPDKPDIQSLFAVIGGEINATASPGYIYPMEPPYNCAGNGVTDDTTCLAAAFTAASATNTTLWLGPHVYVTAAVAPTSGSSIHIIGTIAMWPSFCYSGFKAKAGNQTNLLTLTFGSVAEYVCLETNVSGVNTSGTALSMIQGVSKFLHGYIDGACIGADISGNTQLFEDTYIGNDGGGSSCYGIVVGRVTTLANTVDTIISGVTIQGNSSNPPSADQLIEDAGGLMEVNDNLLYGSTGTIIQPLANQQVTWAFFTNTVLGDTTNGSGLYINAASSSASILGLHFTNTWTGSSTAGNGIEIHNSASGLVDGIDFIGHRSLNITSGNGMYLFGGKNISYNAGFICGYVTGNSGVVISSGATHVKIQDNTIGRTCDGQTGSAGMNTNGVSLLSSPANIMVTGNDLSDNQTEIIGTPTVDANNM